VLHVIMHHYLNLSKISRVHPGGRYIRKHQAETYMLGDCKEKAIMYIPENYLLAVSCQKMHTIGPTKSCLLNRLWPSS
jgi:hypothetical protein